MKNKIDLIFNDLKNKVITEKQAHQQVLDLFAVVGSAVEIPDFVSEDQWWCPKCNMIVEPECVTYEQTHDERCGGCGFMVW